MQQPSDRRVRLRPEDRRNIARLTSLWGMLTLSGLTILAGMTIWHLIRRGRLIRSMLPPPRSVEPLEIPPPVEPT